MCPKSPSHGRGTSRAARCQRMSCCSCRSQFQARAGGDSIVRRDVWREVHQGGWERVPESHSHRSWPRPFEHSLVSSTCLLHARRRATIFSFGVASEKKVCREEMSGATAIRSEITTRLDKLDTLSL